MASGSATFFSPKCLGTKLSLQYAKRYEGPLYDTVVEWFHTEDSRREQMMVAFRLQKYFPNGPAPEDDEQIDVIVTTESCETFPFDTAGWDDQWHFDTL